MDMANPQAQRALAYLAGVIGQGQKVPLAAFEEYAERPERKMKEGFGLRAAFLGIFDQPAESVFEWLARLKWIQQVDGAVSITELGGAVLRHVEKQEADYDLQVELILDPKDPVAYARLIGRIAAAGDALLVDPYFRLTQIPEIVELTRISRILVGPNTKTENEVGLATFLSRGDLSRDIEIRIAKDLHDRYVIPTAGAVEFLGTSLNGVGKTFTVMGRIEIPVADAIRSVFEASWKQAEKLGPKAKEAGG